MSLDSLRLKSLYESESFIKEKTYDGDDLGVTHSKDKTVFKVWAPIAESVSVCLYQVCIICSVQVASIRYLH